MSHLPGLIPILKHMNRPRLPTSKLYPKLIEELYWLGILLTQFRRTLAVTRRFGGMADLLGRVRDTDETRKIRDMNANRAYRAHMIERYWRG